jgi:hypothetical protein
MSLTAEEMNYKKKHFHEVLELHITAVLSPMPRAESEILQPHQIRLLPDVKRVTSESLSYWLLRNRAHEESLPFCVMAPPPSYQH